MNHHKGLRLVNPSTLSVKSFMNYIQVIYSEFIIFSLRLNDIRLIDDKTYFKLLISPMKGLSVWLPYLFSYIEDYHCQAHDNPDFSQYKLKHMRPID